MKTCEGGSLQRRDGGVGGDARAPNACRARFKMGNSRWRDLSHVFVRWGLKRPSSRTGWHHRIPESVILCHRPVPSLTPAPFIETFTAPRKVRRHPGRRSFSRNTRFHRLVLARWEAWLSGEQGTGDGGGRERCRTASGITRYEMEPQGNTV